MPLGIRQKRHPHRRCSRTRGPPGNRGDRRRLVWDLWYGPARISRRTDFVPAPGHPHPISGEEAPVILGHEFSGTISALGEGVIDLAVGQNVVVEPYIIGVDVPIGQGEEYQLSKDMNFIGLGGYGGNLSEKIVVERRWVHPIGDISLDVAALIEPLSVGHHAFVRSGAKAGDVALIGGAGPIGLLLAAVLKAEGLTVFISEPSQARKDKATSTGVADVVFDPSEVDVAEKVRELTGGRGVDVAFECTSVNAVLNILLDAVLPAGVVVNVSIWGHPATVDMQKLVLKEIDLRGTIAYANDHPATIRLVQQGKVNLEPVDQPVWWSGKSARGSPGTKGHRSQIARTFLRVPASGIWCEWATNAPPNAHSSLRKIRINHLGWAQLARGRDPWN